MEPSKKGFLCVIEGADGTGKTTITERIKEKLEQWIKDHEIISNECQTHAWLATVTQLREPHFLRDVIKTTGRSSNWLRLLYFFIRDREEHSKIMGQILQQGNFILMDRFYHSSCVYQGLQAELPPQIILHGHPEWLIKPDITIILDVHGEEVSRRLGVRNDGLKEYKEKDIFDEDVLFQKRVRGCYRNLPKIEGFDDCVLVNAEDDPETVVNNVFKKIEVALMCKFIKK